MRAHHRNVASVIARRLLLLIAAIVLFIDDSEAEILHRGEHSGSCTDDNARVSISNATPLLSALGIVESGMKNGDLVTEPMKELSRDSRSQCDFRHKEQRISTRAPASLRLSGDRLPSSLSP